MRFLGASPLKTLPKLVIADNQLDCWQVGEFAQIELITQAAAKKTHKPALAACVVGKVRKHGIKSNKT